MKLFFMLLISFFLISCGSSPETQNKIDLAEKNKETAIRNEVTRVIELAQKMEKDGRALDYFRNSYFPYDKKECLKVSAEKSAGLEDFKTRVEKLPAPYREKLSPIYEDLEKCFGCEKKSVESCKKSRAAINQIIKEIYQN